MKVPHRIPIMGIDFSIKYPTRISAGADNTNAEIHWDEREIEIARRNATDATRWCAHEFAHGVLEATGLSAGLTDAQNEEIARAFEHALPQAWQLREDVCEFRGLSRGRSARQASKSAK